MTIGKNIHTLRSKKRMSQEKLASKIGITRQTLSNYENDITSPDLEQAKKICEIFDISLDELIGNNNTISSKISSTERLVKKQNKNTKIILITLYVIIMIFLIFITIYFFTKRDFTKKYQMEFICYNKEKKDSYYEISLTGNPLISFKEEHGYYKYYTDEDKALTKNNEDYVYGDYYITMCEYDGNGNGCMPYDIYAGSDIGSAINSMINVKKALIDSGNICY